MVDYDRTNIPEGFDRARDHGLEVLALWMAAIESRVRGRNIRRVLDLGCGTGRFSQALATQLVAEVIGIDPSAKMLARADEKRTEPRVRYARGTAEAIPLDTESIDMIFTSMTFHHFADRAAAARECRRVVRPSGVLVVRAATREQIDAYAYMRFIPEARPLHHDVLPWLRDIRHAFEDAGFRHRSSELITQTIAPNWPAYADKLAAGGDSVLARLSPTVITAGLRRVREHVPPPGRESVTEPIDLLVFERAGRSP